MCGIVEASSGSTWVELSYAARFANQIIIETSQFEQPMTSGDYELAKAMITDFPDITGRIVANAVNFIGDGDAAKACLESGKLVADTRVATLSYFVKYAEAYSEGNQTIIDYYYDKMYESWKKANQYECEFYAKYRDYCK